MFYTVQESSEGYLLKKEGTLCGCITGSEPLLAELIAQSLTVTSRLEAALSQELSNVTSFFVGIEEKGVVMYDIDTETHKVNNLTLIPWRHIAVYPECPLMNFYRERGVL